MTSTRPRPHLVANRSRQPLTKYCCDFQAIVSALLELKVEAATLAWLKAMTPILSLIVAMAQY